MTRRPALLSLTALPVCALIACNQPPEGLEVALGPEGATTSDDLVLEVLSEAVDPNGRDEVLLETTWLRDGVVVEDLSGVQVVPAARTARAERWTVEVTATDGRKPAAPLEDSLVVANTPPTATLTVAKGLVLTDESLRAEATGADADGDEVTILWSWTVDGQDAEVPTDTVPADRTRKGQTWTVTATPTDGLSQGEPRSGEVVIGNTVPSVGATRVDPLLVYETSIVNCRGGGWRDADGDPERYEVAWLVNGSVVHRGPTLDGESFDRGDQLACELTPIDDESAGEPVIGASVDVRNSLARPIRAKLDPEVATITSTLETSVEGIADADGDSAVMRYTWYVNDVKIAHTASFLRPLEHDVRKGDEVKVWMRGYDGIEVGDGPAPSRIIQNSPPSAPSVEVVFADGWLHCAIVADSEDPDVEDVTTYSFSWEVDGSAWTGATGEVDHGGDAVAIADTSGGETWACTVTPSDGEDAGTATSADRTLAME